jgi:hypothetical protein
MANAGDAPTAATKATMVMSFFMFILLSVFELRLFGMRNI